MVGPKILILTTNYGNGHLQVAHSLEQEFIQQGMNSVFVKDLYYETSPRLNELTRKIYLRSFTTSGSHIYQLFYYSSKEISKRKNLKILSYGYSKLKKIIADVEPDIIINTFPSFAVPIHRRKTNSLIPAYNVKQELMKKKLLLQECQLKKTLNTRILKSSFTKISTKPEIENGTYCCWSIRCFKRHEGDL